MSAQTDYALENLRDGLHLIPPHMREGVIEHVERGHRTGGFLTAVLSNDFMEAVAKANSVNSFCLREWAIFLYNHCPSGSYGSPENVAAWRKRGGLGITDEEKVAK